MGSVGFGSAGLGWLGLTGWASRAETSHVYLNVFGFIKSRHLVVLGCVGLGVLGWAGLGWFGLGWVVLFVRWVALSLGRFELNWVGLGSVGLGWVGLSSIGLWWVQLGVVGLGWVGNGMEMGWVGSDWIGLDWIG